MNTAVDCNKSINTNSNKFKQELMLCSAYIGKERISLIQDIKIGKSKEKNTISLERVVLDKNGSVLRKINPNDTKDIIVCFFQNLNNEFNLNESPKLLEQYLLKNAHISEYSRNTYVDIEGRHWDSEIIEFTGDFLEFRNEENNEQQT